MHVLFPDDNVIITELFNIHQDWEVPIPWFFILAPTRKLKSIDEFTDPEAIEFIMLIRKLRKWMRDVLRVNDVYFFQNEDTDHWFHLWIFPRHQWMEEFGRKIQSVRPIMNYAKEQMVNDKIFLEVKESAKKMSEYMSDFKDKAF